MVERDATTKTEEKEREKNSKEAFNVTNARPQEIEKKELKVRREKKKKG